MKVKVKRYIPMEKNTQEKKSVDDRYNSGIHKNRQKLKGIKIDVSKQNINESTRSVRRQKQCGK